uniref:Uncharacterized protein n=1 Tax=Vespula pensylvanica TaxID=30213 RepID=A0A834PE54_VESPE|nr:hypothetical protein H0235_000271 [Vespula pensylvanica]
MEEEFPFHWSNYLTCFCGGVLVGSGGGPSRLVDYTPRKERKMKMMIKKKEEEEEEEEEEEKEEEEDEEEKEEEEVEEVRKASANRKGLSSTRVNNTPANANTHGGDRSYGIFYGKVSLI